MTYNLTQKILFDIFDYDRESGFLYWKSRDRSYFKDQRACSTFNANFPGKRAGYLGSSGYRYVSFLGKEIREHRIVFLYCHGYIPEIIDHINRIKEDNRIENLREATPLINGRNSSKSKRNTSGVTGVTWHSLAKKWQARIKTESGQRSLGLFVDIRDAERARERALKEEGYSEGHGN